MSNPLTLGYEYELNGEVKKIDIFPSNTSVQYNKDKIGRANSIVGQGFSTYHYSNGTSTTITDIASNIHYRSWNQIKSINYGSSVNLSINYDNNLKVSAFRLPSFMEIDYQYQADGQVKFMDNLLDARFDRAYSYDNTARLAVAKTGAQANGGNEMTGPYKESFRFDAFGNSIGRTTIHWTETFEFQSSYSNFRRYGWQHDENGNVTNFDGVVNKIDAADMKIKVTYPYQLLSGTPEFDSNRIYSNQELTYDGDGQVAIEINETKQYYYISGGTITRLDRHSEGKEYNLKSTVLEGAVVFKYVSSYFWDRGMGTTYGWGKTTNVFSQGKLVASMSNSSYNNNNQFHWKHIDPTATTVGASSINILGTLPFSLSAQLDPTGSDVGFSNPYSEEPPPPPMPPFHYEFGSPEAVEMVEVDGVLTPINLFSGWQSVTSQCPRHGCGPIRTENGWEYWTAFGDGYEGYMPINGNYVGNGQWSKLFQEEKKKRKKKPKLKVRDKNAPKPTVKEEDLEKPILPPTPINPNGGFSDVLSKVLAAVMFMTENERVKFIGFTPEQESEIFKRVLLTIVWKPCVDAYKAFPGILATPGEVIRDRGITFINAPELMNSRVESEIGITEEQRVGFLQRVSGLFGFRFGAQAVTGAPNEGNDYKLFPNQRILTVINLGSWSSDLDEDVPHELVHGGGVRGSPPLPGLLPRHDLSNHGAKYNNLLKACKPF